MKSQQFQDILNAVPLLTNQQRNTLINALSEENPSTDIAKTIEESFVRAPKCPHCGSESFQRWGVRNHRQRFRCKTCRRALNAFSKTPLARLRRPEAWSKYLEGMTHSLTLRPAAKQCGDSLHASSKISEIVPLNISRSSMIMRNNFFQTDKTVSSKYKCVTTYIK